MSQQTHVTITPVSPAVSLLPVKTEHILCVSVTLYVIFILCEEERESERCSSFDYCSATFLGVRQAMSSQWEISSSVISPVGELCCLQHLTEGAVALPFCPVPSHLQHSLITHRTAASLHTGSNTQYSHRAHCRKDQHAFCRKEWTRKLNAAIDVWFVGEVWFCLKLTLILFFYIALRF